MKPSKETQVRQSMHYETQKFKHVHDEMVWLTTQIAESNLGMEMVEAAKTGDAEKVKAVLNAFKKDYPILTMEIKELSDFHADMGDPNIFTLKDEKADERILFKYNPEEIDIFNLFIFFWLSGILDAFSIDEDVEIVQMLKKNGHPKMAEYLDAFGINGDIEMIDEIAKDFVEIFCPKEN